MQLSTYCTCGIGTLYDTAQCSWTGCQQFVQLPSKRPHYRVFLLSCTFGANGRNAAALHRKSYGKSAFPEFLSARYRLLYQGEFFYAKRCVHAYMEPCRPVVLTALFLCSQGSKDRLGFVPKESKTRNSTANSANLYSIDGFSRCTPRGLFARGATVSARKSRRPGKNQSPAGYVPGIRSERPVIFIASTNTMPLLVIQRQLFGKQF